MIDFNNIPEGAQRYTTKHGGKYLKRDGDTISYYVRGLDVWVNYEFNCTGHSIWAIANGINVQDDSGTPLTLSESLDLQPVITKKKSAPSNAIIFAVVDSLVSDFLYYDRKEDEELEVGDIEKAVVNGDINIEDIVERFKSKLIKGVK